ncbi:TPA: hypothetical protein HA231_02155 [Candidatus Woesearchaeota archaeon]|nr:hypothetical protein [Candidatus Woesearchaeota archaeon]
MKKHSKAKTRVKPHLGKRPHKAAVKKSSSKKVSRYPVARRQPVAVVHGQKAANEVPTLEQVTITCVNCGRPFQVMKLKGLSMAGTICPRCNVGEMEMPESFG